MSLEQRISTPSSTTTEEECVVEAFNPDGSAHGESERSDVSQEGKGLTGMSMEPSDKPDRVPEEPEESVHRISTAMRL